MVNNNDMTPNPFSKIHHGDNIIFYRELMRMQQKELAAKLNWSQSVLSKLEQMPVVDDEKLKEIADILGLSLEDLKYRNAREAATYFIFNKDVNNFVNGTQDSGVKNIHNPIEKVAELYERLLLVEKENAALKQENERLKK